MQAGSVLGPYRIDRELGSGGMGKVFAATVTGRAPGIDEGTQIALKIVHPHLLETAGFFKRFIREAEIGKAVRHPNVVATLDCDSLMDAGARRDVLAMEYVEGQTLRGLLDEMGQVPEELCRHIAREVCKGLAAIHGVGVVHRDVKPENVLITGDHVVKIMDLGVARRIDEAVRLSQTGAFVGSVHYAAPEQFQSSGKDVDGRADLHALGLVLYELASGIQPYDADDVQQVLHKVLREEPRRLGDINAQLSPFYEETVHCLLAKDRDARFADARALLDVLESGEDSDWWKARARSIRADTQRPIRRIRIARETSVYGRESELAKLRALYDAAADGDGCVVLLEGEAGIGKSRLVDELIVRLQRDGEDLNFLFGGYPPGGASTAEGGFSTAYREHLGDTGSRHLLKQTPLLAPAFDALLRGDARPEDAQALTKHSLQTCFVHATRSLAAERTTVVLIDDLHFAPDGGRDLFTALAMAVPGHRVLLVGTTRRTVSRDWLAGVSRLDQTTHMELGRLGAKDLFSLLQDTFQSERLAANLAGQIGRKSDGNPFFVFAIVRGLREGQFITQQADGAWQNTSVIEHIQIPSSVMDLIEGRVAELSEEDRELLDVAACCGFEFDGTLVAEALGMARIPAFRRLGHLEKKHHLVCSSGRNHVFDHHQVREALYDGLSEVLREEYHAALGETLEARSGGSPSGAVCLELCGHFFAANRCERALGHLDGALDHLAEGYLHEQAVALSHRALGVAGLVEGERRVRLLLRRADWLVNIGRPEPIAPGLEEALALADELALPELQIAARRTLSNQHRHIAEYARAHALLDRALELARASGERVLEGNLTNALATLLYFEDRFDESCALFEKQLAIAEKTGERRQEAMAGSNMGLVLLAQGRNDEARERFERTLEIADEIGDRHGQSVAIGNLGGVHYARGRWSLAREHFERDLAINRQIGDRRSEVGVTGNLGIVVRAQGHWGEAREYHERHVSLAREMGDRTSEDTALGTYATWYARMGDLETARQYIEESLAVAREIGDRRTLGWSTRRRGVIDAWAGQFERAMSRFDEAIAIARELGVNGLLCEILNDLAAAHQAMDRHDDARAALEEAAELARGVGSPGLIALTACYRARLPGEPSQPARDAVEEYDDRLQFVIRLEARFVLWLLDHDPADLAEAHRLLTYLRDHSPEEFHETMMRNVPLHRDIVSAHGER